jgi:glucose-6-phosphate 1-dehydrogenase
MSAAGDAPAAKLDAADAVAIEKPFGTDLASAHRLNEILRIQLPQPTIFRIDHFLSDELVRRVIVLRFLNRVFEPVLNAAHVERVDISWLESLTLEGRASYYDTAGALKDMVQNHLMEAMALVLMAQPARLDADSFRSVCSPAAVTLAARRASQRAPNIRRAASSCACGRRPRAPARDDSGSPGCPAYRPSQALGDPTGTTGLGPATSLVRRRSAPTTRAGPGNAPAPPGYPR